MPITVQLFLLLLVVSSIVASWVVVFLLPRQKVPGAMFLAIMLITCVIWNVGYFIELIGRDFDAKMIGVYISYFGIPFTPVFWFLFVQQYVTHWSGPTKKGVALSLVIPTITLILALTTLHHNLFYLHPAMQRVGSFQLIIKQQGFWFQVHVFYSYLMLALGSIFLYKKYRDQKSTFRMQSYYMLVAVALPWIASIIYVFGMSTFLPLDFTNAAFSLSGAFIGYTIFKYKLFELMPQAKEQVFDELSVAIIVCDVNFHIVEFNKMASSMLPFSLGIGKSIDAVFPPNSDWLSIKSGDEFIGEIALFSKTYTLTAKGILSDKHGLLGYSLVFSDITYQKEIEHGLESLNRTKDKFFSIIAHDLKNPFFGLLGFSNLLVEQIATMDKAEILQMVKYIQELSGNTYKMLETLLDWARTQTNAIEYSPEQFSLNEVLLECVENANGNARLKSITLSIDLFEDISVYADKNMCRTVIRNLISNAIKFTPLGGSVRTGVYAGTEFNCCMVKDTGIGFPEDKAANVFSISERKSSTGTSGEQGTGLGLVICKELMVKNNGDIQLKSTPNEGSEFTVFFPKNKPQEN